MSDAASERLAPVTYLPWVRTGGARAPEAATPPSADESTRPTPSVAPRTAPAPSESRPLSTRPVARRLAAPKPPCRASVEPPSTRDETGVERDDAHRPAGRLPPATIGTLGRRGAIRARRARARRASRSTSGSSGTSASATSTTRGSPSSSCTATGFAPRPGQRRHPARAARAVASIPRQARAAVDDLDPETERRERAGRRRTPCASASRARPARRPSAGSRRSCSGGATPSDVVREAVTAAMAAAGS